MLLLRAFVIVSLLGLLVASCGTDPDADQADPDAGQDAGDGDDEETGGDDDQTGDGGGDGDGGGEDESVVVVAIDSDISGVDPQRGGGRPERWVTENAFESPLVRDDQGVQQPHLATEWFSNEDATVWTLELRDDVTFHNGEHMTGEDVKASLERLVHPDVGSQQAPFWSGVEEVVVVDDYEVEFHLAEPNPLLMVWGERLPIAPKSWVEEVGNEPYTGDEPIGSGAYRLVEWRRDDRVVFEAFDDYFLGRPAIDRAIFRVIPDESARVAALRAGEVDIVFRLSPNLAEQVEADPDLDLHRAGSLERVRLTIDTRESPWDIREVRQAVNYALDVQSIVDNLVPGGVVIPAALVPEEPGFNPDLEPYPYDPERARELLADAGFADGIGPVEFSVNRGFPNAEDVASAIAAQLADVGIQTEMTVLDASDVNERKNEKEENPGALGPLQFDGHGGGAAFHGYFHYLNVVGCNGSPIHAGYYCNPEIDALIDEAVQLWAKDEERSIELIQEAEAMLHEDAWAGFLFQTPMDFGLRSTLDWTPDITNQLLMRLASWEE